MNDRSDFTQGKIAPKLLRFMIPILGALILQGMYGAADILVVGRFGTTSGIAAVSTGSNVVNLVIFTVTALSMGVTVLIGRYLGERRPERIGYVIGGAVFFFAVSSLLISLVMLVFARQLALLMQVPPEALSLTILYIRICGGGIFFIIAYNVISAIFRGLGDSRMPLLFVAIACVVNIIGDLFFVAVLHMNVAGAALATVMAQAVSVILSLLIIRRRDLPFSLSADQIRPNPEVARFIKIGTPIAFQEILTQLSFLALCAFINRLGLDASSGYGIASKIVSFVMLIPGSLLQSMAAFVSQNVGAGREDRAARALFTGICIGAGLGVFVTIFTYLHGDIPAAFFSHDAAVIKRAFEYLRGFAPEAIVTPIMFSFVGYYNGHEKTVFVFLQGFIQTVLVRLPVSWYMSIQPGASLQMIGSAAPLATCCGILMNLIYFFILRKKIKKRSASDLSGNH